MQTTIASTPFNLKAIFMRYSPILLGLMALYIPTYFYLSQTLWQKEDQAHGPLILAVIFYLFWINHKEFLACKSKPSLITGWVLFILGLVFYILGKSQDILIFEIGSQLVVLMGLILIFKGFKALRIVWFPIFFFVFLLPLPGAFVSAITLPMKMAVSYVVENVLYWLDYPISRNGVMLQIGQYQLLVADACAGLHTLISLEALGLLYLNIVKHDSAIRNIVMAIFIIPISFTANVIRVITLTLVTYYFGDEAGQGFVHGFAGMVLFVVALILIISMDTILQKFVKWREKRIQTAG